MEESQIQFESLEEYPTSCAKGFLERKGQRQVSSEDCRVPTHGETKSTGI